LYFGKEYLKQCRYPNAFQLLTIDSSRFFLKTSLKRIPEQIQKFVTGHISQIELFEFGGPGGQIANRWTDLPNFNPDLIYTDGSDPKQITTKINRYKSESFSLLISADILHRGYLLCSGTQIIVHGRGANAEFLSLNLKRNWHYFRTISTIDIFSN
jgi:hypothetical protein